MIPFDDQTSKDVAAWLSLPEAPDVRAVRVACDNEDDWLAARVGGIGASEVGVIVGASSWSSPYALWWRKSLDWRLPRTEAQRWGHLVEDPIAELFAEEMQGQLFIAKPVGSPYSLWCHPVSQWMLCTPDRLAVDPSGGIAPVELKSDEGGPGWGEPGTDEVPEHHRIQGMWQAHIFGAAGSYIVRKRGSGKRRMVWYWVPYDPAQVAVWKTAASDFLLSIENDTPPEPDGARSTTETLKEINPAIDAGEFALVARSLAAEWRTARAEKRAAIAREALASNKMRAAMGRAEFAATLTPDRLTVIVAKRRMGKRAGYEVPPGTTDELREIGSGQHDEDPPVRAEPDPGTATAPAEEGDRGGGDPGTGLGDSEAAGTTEEDPAGVAGLTDEVVDALAAEAEAGYDVDKLIPRCPRVGMHNHCAIHGGWDNHDRAPGGIY